MKYFKNLFPKVTQSQKKAALNYVTLWCIFFLLHDCCVRNTSKCARCEKFMLLLILLYVRWGLCCTAIIKGIQRMNWEWERKEERKPLKLISNIIIQNSVVRRSFLPPFLSCKLPHNLYKIIGRWTAPDKCFNTYKYMYICIQYVYTYSFEISKRFRFLFELSAFLLLRFIALYENLQSKTW